MGFLSGITSFVKEHSEVIHGVLDVAGFIPGGLYTRAGIGINNKFKNPILSGSDKKGTIAWYII